MYHTDDPDETGNDSFETQASRRSAESFARLAIFDIARGLLAFEQCSRENALRNESLA